MEKMVHVWKIHCGKCGTDFDHIFRARDVFRPHIFASLEFKCPKCGGMDFDHVTPISKEPLEDWKMQHPELDINNLPDYSYLEDGSGQ